MEPLTISEILVRFSLAVVLSGVIGLERERKARAAGLRTHVLVCLGSTLAMVISDMMAREWVGQGAPVWLDRGRVAAGILTGVGFLGAGTIINVAGLQRGLTTAAMVWFVAALGVAVGSGYYVIGAIGTAFTLVAVVGLEYVEDRLPLTERFILTVELPDGLNRMADVLACIHEEGYSSQPVGIKVGEGSNGVELSVEIASHRRTRVAGLIERLQKEFPAARRIECRR